MPNNNTKEIVITDEELEFVKKKIGKRKPSILRVQQILKCSFLKANFIYKKLYL